jgi:hypothetical protein
MIGDHSQRAEFSARIVFAHGEIQSCEVFTWELEPHDTPRRAMRDWVHEHLTEGLNLCDEFDIDNPCWEAVFKGVLHGYLDFNREWEEYMEFDRVHDLLLQPLPEEWFDE